ncbi:MAG: sialate O-acetylesterase [Verrucomicrobiota bacterium]|nr:sialate O-acetylesterase [Verrucomicrobiota bacterium]
MPKPIAASISRLLCALILSVTFPLYADVRLHQLFTDHMVLQQGKPVPVWGWADEGEQVVVSFNGKKVSTQAKDGKWKVLLPKQKASNKPATLMVQGKNRLEVKDVLVGEVWVCSGQSNMEWGMTSSYQPENAIKSATNNLIRLFTVPKLKATEPVYEVSSKWVECSPETIKQFSAVGYYFGRDLQQALNVPVGLIHTSWGGSPAEVWMSPEFLQNNEEYRTDILAAVPEQQQNYIKTVKQWEAEKAALEKEGKQMTRGRPWANWVPSELYLGMIKPLIPYAIAGAIWYQGESNAGRADQYRRLFPDMIRNWRQDWGQGDFPFLFVQLAPWDKNRKRSMEQIVGEIGDSDWAELREAQTLTLSALPNTGMAVITDVGDKDDIHPAKKEPVGSRLALAARKIAYGQKVVSSGPLFKKMKIEDSTAIIHFDQVGGGLVAEGSRLTGFTIAGEDKKFVPAEARIEGNKVIVSSPKIEKPIAVRYGWADYPVTNLKNKEGLPASPFRTDDFPMITSKKK